VFGIIDKNGNVISPPQWDSPCYFNDGYATAELDGKKYIIDEDGNISDNKQKL